MIMEKNNKKEVGLIDYSKQGHHHWGEGGWRGPAPTTRQ